MIRTALRLRHDMIDGEVAEREQHPTTGAVPFLPPIQRVLVGAVVRERTQVGALGQIGSVGDIIEQRPLIVSDAFEHQPCSDLGKVDADPLALQPIR